ncbi:MAG: hypothetical protein ABI763_08215 [Bacteroidota bacterium]
MSTTTVAPIKKETSNGTSSTENQKGIENHKRIAAHFEAASKHHLEAAKHHEAGNHEKAASCSIAAHGENCLANDAQREDAKHHALAAKM